MIRLDQGDNRASLRAMVRRGEFVQSVVCDPPYGLTSVKKRFGKEGSASAQYGEDGLFQRQSKGMMGKLWDGTGIERDPEFWRLVYDAMLPGAYIVAFSSTRTYHHMALALEDAGFITHPLLIWTFASGFPKAHNASRAIDKVLGTSEAREVVNERYTAKRIKPGATVVAEGGYGKQDIDFTAVDDIGGSDEAQQWDGWSYGGQALKPALEPIYVGQKPFSEKNGALNLLKHGVGAMNIDGCRVAMSEIDRNKINNMGGYGVGAEYRVPNGGLSLSGSVDGSYEAGRPVVGAHDLGRWPANLLHDGSPEVLALFPDSKGQQATSLTDGSLHKNAVYGAMVNSGPVHEPRNDSGSAARFFNSFPHEGPLLHHPKAGKKDRAESRHATVKPVALMRHLVRLVTPPGGTCLDPFAGSGTTAEAARLEGVDCIMMEAEQEYIRDICRRFDLEPGLRNLLWQAEEAVKCDW